MPRYLLPFFLFAALLLLRGEARGANPSGTACVIARGPFAGTQLVAAPNGEVRPADNSAGGARGRVISLDRGRTLVYQDAGGGVVEVVRLEPLPAHIQRLSSAVSRLRAVARWRVSGNALRDEVAVAVTDLEQAAQGWQAAAGYSAYESGQPLRELDQATNELRDVLLAGNDADTQRAVQSVLPRLHAAAAVALAQPRDTVTITLEATAIDFGEVPVGASVESAIHVTTTSTTRLDIPVNTGGLTSPFAYTGGSTLQLYQGSGARMTVRFAPVAEGEFTGQLVLTHPAFPGGSSTIQVRGKGVPAKVVVTPRPLDFGRVHVRDSRTLPLTVRNSTSGPLEIETSLGVSKPFSHGALSDVNGTFQPGETGSINISFSPKKAGRFSGTVVVRAPAARGIIEVAVTGVAVGDFSLSEDDLDFGTVNVGTTASRQVTLTNNTDGPLTVSIKGVQSPFGVGTIARTLPANQSTTFNVNFRPTRIGPALGRIQVETTGPGGKYHLPISLKGVGQRAALTGVSLSRTGIDFGTVPKRTQVEQTFTVTNTSTAPVTVTLDRSELPDGFFGIGGGMSFTLEPGQAHNVLIAFQAFNPCRHRGKIQVSANGGSADVDVSAAAR